jgi:hypothetical protein
MPIVSVVLFPGPTVGWYAVVTLTRRVWWWASSIRALVLGNTLRVGPPECETFRRALPKPNHLFGDEVFHRWAVAIAVSRPDSGTDTATLRTCRDPTLTDLTTKGWVKLAQF